MPPDVAALLAEADWLTRLARSLVGSCAEADDVVQEAYVAALRSPPDPARPARPWLRRVVVNIVRMRHRGRVRRDAREAEVFGDAPRSPEQLLERARVERTLADLVLTLEEPLRTTVLLRYREGLTSTQIAEREGVPAGTVRRRLKTAVDRLRVQLDDKDDSKTWRAAFAPFLVPRRSASWWRILMANAATKTGVAIIAAVLLLLGGGAAWWWTAHRSTTTPSSTLVHAATKQTPIDQSGANAAKVFAQAGVGTREVSGHVTFAGKPFAGATVRIVHSLTRTAIAEQTSGADGSFVFAGLSADAYVASAAADDATAMPVVVDLRAPKVESVELSLVACSHLRGIVSDGSGAPIAHAHVARAETAWPFAETNELGHYDLCTHFGDAQILFTASGYHGVLARVPINSASQRDMVLLPEATIAGTVIADGKPIADAWVTIDPRGKGAIRDAPVRVRSAADGSFRITGVASGRSELSAIAPGLASPAIGIVVGAGETREGLIVRLDAAVTLSGHVLANGQPIAGAAVGLRIGGLERDGLAVTQSDGSFTIARAPPGELAISVEGYTVLTPHTVTVVADTRVEVQAKELGRVIGKVTRRGAPVADATVTCPRSYDRPPVVTAQDGSFSCVLTDNGPFSLIAIDAEGRWGMATGNGASAVVAIDLALEGAICGTVSDEAGKPLRGITINASNASGDDTGDDVSNDQGGFCVRYLGNEGAFTITASNGGQRLEPVTPIQPVALVDRHATIAIVLAAPKLGISGIVVDAAGAPIADASVRAHAGGGGAFLFDETNPLLLALTDQNGHFSIDRLTPGAYTVLATARDGAERIQQPVAAGASDVRLVLDAAGSIEGTLAGFTTPPVIIGIALAGGHEPVDLEVDGDHFSATGLAPGTYMLSANCNCGGDAKRVVVTTGKATVVVLTARGTATITGKVIDWKSRAPVAGARCGAPAARDGVDVGVVYSSPDDGVLADANGVYRLEDVSAGDALVSCNTNLQHGVRFATVARGSVVQLDVYVVAVTGLGAIDIRFAGMSRILDRIDAGGQAEKAGLLVGDEVVAIDGASVTELDGSATLAVIGNNASKTIAITVKRGAGIHTANVFVHPPDN